ncbi:MAG: hypothetical protein JNM85_08880 [Chthonomonas sp.]|nr:hypothetical protein [Chthonomonas sp.]
MKKLITIGATIAVMAVIAVAAVKSGLDKGDSISAFHPQHISGPLANSTSCFPCTFKQRPQVQVWVNGDQHNNILAIAKDLDNAIEKYSKTEFKAMVVFLSDPAKVDATKSMVMKAMEGKNLNRIAVAVLANNHSAVTDYKINLKAKNTVFVYKNWKVTNKMVDFNADSKGLTTLNAAIAEIAK